MKDILEKAARIRLVVFDVDGVLTDGSLFVGDDGQEYKAFHSRDGHGIKMLMGHGVEVARGFTSFGLSMESRGAFISKGRRDPRLARPL